MSGSAMQFDVADSMADCEPPNALLTIALDDPADGPSLGPNAHGYARGIPPEFGIQSAVVWSGAWDNDIWQSIVTAAMEHNIRVLIVMTQTAHHKAWVRAVGRSIPLLEVKPHD